MCVTYSMEVGRRPAAFGADIVSAYFKVLNMQRLADVTKELYQ